MIKERITCLDSHDQLITLPKVLICTWPMNHFINMIGKHYYSFHATVFPCFLSVRRLNTKDVASLEVSDDLKQSYLSFDFIRKCFLLRSIQC